jgi:predicted NUDIX family NTP pyrophosphohydrolase
VWSIPKGEYGDDEEPLTAARREFAEELGSPTPEAAPPLDLGEVRQKSGKRVRAWALPGDLDAAVITSNTFEMQWPPRSGRMQAFPEVDRAQWFDLSVAAEKLNPGQVPLLQRLIEAVGE